ncbi:MAG: hypothetical protein AAB393_02215, partial [Bacteroidota bacterium]
LKQIYQRLDENEPLKPDDPRYQPVYDYPGCDNPVELMQKHIEWSGVESVQLFSGFRGSGKTTELLRLQKQLEDKGYVVLYADALDYLSPSEEVDIANLLIVLAGAFSDALGDKIGMDVAGESYWTRFKNYLTQTAVEIPEVTVPGVDLKLSLKTSPSFRQKLEQFLAHRIGQLKNHVDQFIEDGVKTIRERRGEETQVVFIFDSLEQVRGSRSNEQAVIRSVERLFANYYPKMLTLPYLHAVYTVPPWLKFAAPNITKIIIIPCVRQWENDAGRNKHKEGCNALCFLVGKRFGEEGSKRCFGELSREPSQVEAKDMPGEEGSEGCCSESCGHCNPSVQKILDVCGGHFRDLLLLLRETLLRAKSLPVSAEVIEAAISEVRSHFLPIAIEDARWLHQIAELRTAALPSVSPEDVNRLTRFLDTHFVLYFRNGNEW